MSNYLLPATMDISLKPSIRNGQAEILSQNVMGIAVVNTINSVGLFHARLFLCFANGTAISFDPSPVNPVGSEFTCCIIVDLRRSSSTSNPNKTEDFRVHVGTPGSAPVTAAQICYRLFNQAKFEKYFFNSSGAGCRHWCAKVIGFLQGQGILHNRATAEFENWERAQHAAFGASFPVPRHTGRFAQ